MPNTRERIVIEDDIYGRFEVTREPAPELAVFAGTGPGRGEYEERAASNDNGAGVRVEYTPPPGGPRG